MAGHHRIREPPLLYFLLGSLFLGSMLSTTWTQHVFKIITSLHLNERMSVEIQSQSEKSLNTKELSHSEESLLILMHFLYAVLSSQS